MKYILIPLMLLSVASAAEVKKPKLPYSLTSAEKTLIRDADKALKAYNDAIEKATAKYLKTLNSELTKAMKKGDLALANYINEKKKDLETLKAAAAAAKVITFDKKEVKAQTNKLVITKATWGAKTSFVDVTNILTKHIVNNGLNVVVDYKLGMPDPIFGTVKSLEVEYVYMGKKGKVTVAENDTISIGTKK